MLILILTSFTVAVIANTIVKGDQLAYFIVVECSLKYNHELMTIFIASQNYCGS